MPAIENASVVTPEAGVNTTAPTPSTNARNKRNVAAFNSMIEKMEALKGERPNLILAIVLRPDPRLSGPYTCFTRSRQMLLIGFAEDVVEDVSTLETCLGYCKK